MESNGSAPPTKGEATPTPKCLPKLSNAIALSKNHRQSGTVAYKSLDNDEKASNQQLQPDWLSTETPKRFGYNLYCMHSGAIWKIMDIFLRRFLC